MSRADVIADVAAKVGTSAKWLDNLIRFESGYNTTIKNPLPSSTARGLIQITNGPARELGFADSLDAVNKFSGFEAQMYHVVMPYLQMQRDRYGSLNTEQALYMSVFYPTYMHVDPQTAFPPDVQKNNIITIAGVRVPIATPLDYINHVRRKAGAALLPKAVPALAVAAGVGIVVWLYLRRRKKIRKNPFLLGILSPIPGPWL